MFKVYVAFSYFIDESSSLRVISINRELQFLQPSKLLGEVVV